MTAGSSTGRSSVRGMNGEFPSSMSLSDLALSKASNDNSVNNDDCSHDESFSCKNYITLDLIAAQINTQ